MQTYQEWLDGENEPPYNELNSKIETIRKLQIQLGEKDKKIAQLERDKEIYLNRALLSESDIIPVRKSLNSMTAEKGKLIRKLKRLEARSK